MTIKFLTIEMHVMQSMEASTAAYDEAIATPWWQWIRRALLFRKASVHEREMDTWAAQLYAELAAERHVAAPRDLQGELDELSRGLRRGWEGTD